MDTPRIPLSLTHPRLQMIIRLAALSLLFAFSVRAGEFNPFAGPKPVAVFIQTNPWATVIGSDTPRFALYEDRNVVFLKSPKSGRAFRSAQLDEKRFSALVKRVQSLAELPDLKLRYMVRGATDQPEAKFCIRLNNRYITSTAYGLTDDHPAMKGWMDYPAEKIPGRLPKEFRSLHKALLEFDVPGAVAWQPKYLEVMIWPYEYAPDESIHWPPQWPGLDSERALRRGDSYSIFIDGSRLSDLLKLLATRKAKGALEIGGKKWAVSWRRTFPNEPVWRAAFRGGWKAEGGDNKNQ